ncbi:MAG: hypothetical protein U0457_09350 [Candidatus Sericytochromatia bacterium]
MKRFFRKYVKLPITLASFIFFTSCTLLGTYKLEPKYPYSQEFFTTNEKKESVKIINEKLEENINLSLEWIGNAYPMETAKNMTGSISRFVIPYTRKTSLFKIKIENKTNKNIFLDSENITLKDLSNSSELKPLGIEFFNLAWPTFAVKNQEMLIDQSTALGEVIRTIFRDKTILPDSEYTAYIPFNIIDKETKNLELNLKIKIENNYKNLSFKYSRK